MNGDLGHRLLGLSVILFGGITLAAHEFGLLQLGNGTAGTIATCIVGAAYVVGGVLILVPATLRAGSALTAVVFGASALVYLYSIATHLSVAGIWDGLFERLGIFCGALVVFACTSDRHSAPLLAGARVLFGVCIVSYTLAQALFLNATATLVPHWLPPGQMFWAALTTVAFALAAISFLSGWLTRLASWLLTLMILVFGVTIWIPKAIEAPSSLFVWSEFAWTFAIASVAWIFADQLRSTSAEPTHPLHPQASRP